MNEYASRFFMLIDQASRMDAIDSINQLKIASFPHQKQSQQRETIKEYQKKAHGTVVATPAIIEQDSIRLMAILGIKQNNG